MAIIVSGLAASFGGLAEDSGTTGADLAASDLLWTDVFGAEESVSPPITSGQPYAVRAVIENTGTADADGFSAALYIDGALRGSATVASGLAAQDTLTVSWMDIITSDAGSHEALVMVDSENTVPELNEAGTAESNNELAEPFSVVLAKWTFAVYLDGDNNLEYAGLADFLEMAAVGTTPDMSVVVQFDRIGGLYTDYGDWTSAKRFLVTQGMEPIPECAYEDLGEVNMGDTAALSDFGSEAFGRFKAERTCLVLWDHGASWYGGCCRDQTSSNDSLMLDEMRAALSEVTGVVGSPLDIVGFDACVMGSIEVCYALQGLCVNFLASESNVPNYGLPYDDVLLALAGTPSMVPEQLCEIIATEYVLEDTFYSAISMAAFRVDDVCTRVRDSVSELADSLLAGMPKLDGRIASARDKVLGFDRTYTDNSYKDTYSADLYYFALEVALRISDDRVRLAAENVTRALEDARVTFAYYAGWSGFEDAFGITIFWPDIPAYLEEYTLQLFAQDTTWDEFLLEFYAE